MKPVFHQAHSRPTEQPPASGAAPQTGPEAIPDDPSGFFARRWEEDRKYRYDPAILTSLLREQVPVLSFAQWSVEAVEPGRSRTALPLNSECTNQHCTHQAALLFLAADYTGGIALASLLPGWPAVGVHPVHSSDKSMALWLVKGEIKYMRPSCERLDVIAEVEPERRDLLRKRFLQGKPVVEEIVVRFRNGRSDVAEAVMVYFARQSDKLRTEDVSPDKVNVLYQHKLISSAELIAGVRAQQSGSLFVDPYAAQLAGEHGLALARRFCERSPQLGGMIAARTRHLDLQMLEFFRRGGRNIVLLGAGYDMRPFRLELPAGTRVFELDFPTVLADRDRRIEACGCQMPEGVQRVRVPIDLRATRLADALRGCLDFDQPVFVACEGMSMYFEEPELEAILGGILPVLRNSQSVLWIDFVDERIVQSPDAFPEVAAFIHGMQMLGEPFVFGAASVDGFMEKSGFQCRQVVSSSAFFSDVYDPVFTLYNFCVASASNLPQSEIATDASWDLHSAHDKPAAESPLARKIPDSTP